ncbi:MAG TPA: exodeoxyribonuclease III [Syntrophales bacterium]|nr:exodeoxyribonuclease III [Syntrophales bacterium]
MVTCAMPLFRIATYNVNSIRSRLHIVIPWLERNRPVVLCMQETKVSDDLFPADEFRKIGYHVVFRGGKKGNGVAVAAPETPREVKFGIDDGKEPCEDRLITGIFGGVPVINAYAPQGFKMQAPQFQFKLEWYGRFREILSRRFSPKGRLVVCGDLNVAPEPIDVHNPKRLLGHVDFNPEVWKEFEELKKWGLLDVFRKHHAGEAGRYTFFDYRIPGTVERNIGWRVDHILATRTLAVRSVRCDIDMEPRLAEKASDHTILFADFNIT